MLTRIIYPSLIAFALGVVSAAQVFSTNLAEESLPLSSTVQLNASPLQGLPDDDSTGHPAKRIKSQPNFNNINRDVSLGNLKGIPNDVIISILQYGNVSDIASFSRASKQLRKLTHVAFKQALDLREIFRTSSLRSTINEVDAKYYISPYKDYSECLKILRQRINMVPNLGNATRNNVAIFLTDIKSEDFNVKWYRGAFLKVLAVPGSHLEQQIDKQNDDWFGERQHIVYKTPLLLICSTSNLINKMSFIQRHVSRPMQTSANSRYFVYTTPSINEMLPPHVIKGYEATWPQFIIEELYSRNLDFNTLDEKARNQLALVFQELCTACYNNKDFRKAAEYTERAIAFNPRGVGRFYTMAKKYYTRLGNFKKAEEYGKKHLSIVDWDIFAYIDLINIYNRQENFAEAVKYAEMATTKREELSSLFAAVALAYYGDQKFENAAQYAVQNINENPYDPLSYYIAADAYNKLGNFEQAQEYFKKASANKYYNIALADINDANKADQFFRCAAYCSLRDKAFVEASNYYEELHKHGWTNPSPRPVDYARWAYAYVKTSQQNRFKKAQPLVDESFKTAEGSTSIDKVDDWKTRLGEVIDAFKDVKKYSKKVIEWNKKLASYNQTAPTLEHK